MQYLMITRLAEFALAVRPEILSNLSPNKSLKPTVTRVTPFAAKANPAPPYGGLVPPLYL